MSQQLGGKKKVCQGGGKSSVLKTEQKKPGMESLLGACCYQEQRTPATWAIQTVIEKYFNGRLWPTCPGSSLLASHIF